MEYASGGDLVFLYYSSKYIFFLDLQVIFIPGVTRKICTRNFKQVISYVLKGSLYLTW